MSNNVDFNDDEFAGRPHLVRQKARAELWDNIFSWIRTLILVTILGLVILSIRTNNQDRDNLLDCTTEQGICYQKSQENTKRVVDALVQRISGDAGLTRTVVVLATWCGDQPDVRTVAQLESCINEGLSKYGHLSIRGEETDQTGRK